MRWTLNMSDIMLYACFGRWTWPIGILDTESSGFWYLDIESSGFGSSLVATLGRVYTSLGEIKSSGGIQTKYSKIDMFLWGDPNQAWNPKLDILCGDLKIWYKIWTRKMNTKSEHEKNQSWRGTRPSTTRAVHRLEAGLEAAAPFIVIFGALDNQARLL